MKISHAASLSQRSPQSLRTCTLMLPLAASVYCMGLAPDVRAQAVQYIEQSQIRMQPQVAFTQQDLDQMLAPIALYPDSLLSQILMAATYPLEVGQAARWSRAHPGLSGDDAVRAVANRNWDPSVKSMTAFPQILSRMDERLDWTQRLGDAFLDQEPHVMETVQTLRQRAYAAGNLNSDGQVRVVRQERIILVEPVNPQVVYLPYYDPTVIYGSWWWPAPPVYWRPWAGHAPAHVRPGVRVGFLWGSGVRISAGFFFGHPDWQRRNVNVVHVNNYYHHHTVVNRGPDRSHAGPTRWRHDPSHRGSTPYRDSAVREQFAAQQRQAVEQREHRRHEARHETQAEVHRGAEARHERDRDGRGWDGRADNGYGNRNRSAVTAPAPAAVQSQPAQAAAPQPQEARPNAAAAQRAHAQEQRHARQRDINQAVDGDRNAERNFSRRDDRRDDRRYDGRRDGRVDARPERETGARSDTAPGALPPIQRSHQALARQRQQAEETQGQQQQVQHHAGQVQHQQQAERVRREQQRHAEQVQRQLQQLQAEQVRQQQPRQVESAQRQQQQVQQRQQQEARRDEMRRDARAAGGQRDERGEGSGRGEGRNRLSAS